MWTDTPSTPSTARAVHRPRPGRKRENPPSTASSGDRTHPPRLAPLTTSTASIRCSWRKKPFRGSSWWKAKKTRWCWQKPATDMSSAYRREPQATWANPSKRFSHGWNKWTTSWSAVTPTCPAAHSPSGCRTTSTPAVSSSPCPADART